MTYLLRREYGADSHFYWGWNPADRTVIRGWYGSIFAFRYDSLGEAKSIASDLATRLEISIDIVNEDLERIETVPWPKAMKTEVNHKPFSASTSAMNLSSCSIGFIPGLATGPLVDVEGRLPDSGAREVFGENLAHREADPDKPAMEGVSPFAMIRLGRLMTKANDKYGDYRNWEKGMPILRYIGGIIRHAFAYLARDTSEDHLASVMWNAMCIIHHEEVGSLSGKTFAELDNRPKWKP